MELLRALFDTPDRTVDELSAATGLHPNTTREHLQHLIEAGFVVSEVAEADGPGRPRRIYRPATAEHDNPIAESRARDAEHRGDLMRRVMPELDNGTGEGAQHQVDVLEDHLDRAGFDPVFTDDVTVQLHTCPFINLVHEHKDRVCTTHLRVINATLERTDGPFTRGELLPFATKDCCTLRLISE